MSFVLRPTVRAVPASTRSFSSTRASQLARMTIIGRLGAAPEAVTTNGDRTLVRYILGTDSGRGEKKKTSWFRVASFVEGAQKEFLLNVPKGAMLYVDADARMETFEDKETGQPRSSLGLIARNFEVLQRPRTGAVDANDEGLVQDGSA
ncbi:ssDNA-binding protein, mitochondrial [Pleosporales sp. CAS-2024a]